MIIIVSGCAILRNVLEYRWYILDGSSHAALAIVDDRTLRGAFVQQLFERFCCARPSLVEIIIESTTALLYAVLSTNSIVSNDYRPLTHRHRTRAFPSASGDSEHVHVLKDPTVGSTNLRIRLIPGEGIVDEGRICSRLLSTT